MNICVYSIYIDIIYKLVFISCYWYLSEVSLETLLISLFLVTKWRVGGECCELRTYMSEHFEEQRWLSRSSFCVKQHHLCEWSLRNLRKGRWFWGLLKMVVLSKITRADLHQSGGRDGTSQREREGRAQEPGWLGSEEPGARSCKCDLNLAPCLSIFWLQYLLSEIGVTFCLLQGILWGSSFYQIKAFWKAQRQCKCK